MSVVDRTSDGTDGVPEVLVSLRGEMLPWASGGLPVEIFLQAASRNGPAAHWARLIPVFDGRHTQNRGTSKTNIPDYASRAALVLCSILAVGRSLFQARLSGVFCPPTLFRM